MRAKFCLQKQKNCPDKGRTAKFDPRMLSPRSLARISKIFKTTVKSEATETSSTWEGDRTDDSSKA